MRTPNLVSTDPDGLNSHAWNSHGGGCGCSGCASHDTAPILGRCASHDTAGDDCGAVGCDGALGGAEGGGGALPSCGREGHLADESRWDELTIEVRERLIVETDTLVNHASINDKNCIRLITANFDLTPEDIDKFMNNVEIISQKVIHELNS